MFQKFYEDTIFGRFIKRLIRSTNLPLLNVIEEGETITANCCYIHDRYIIRCVTTGAFHMWQTVNDLYPSSQIYPEFSLSPGGKEATYQIISYYDNDNIQQNYTYHSRDLTYDTETHYYLGEYLRFLKHTSGLDLMAYYNCFNYKSVTGVELVNPSSNTESSSVGYSLEPVGNYKLIAIPVKFSHTYTIAIDCAAEVLMRCVVYGDSGMVIRNINDSKPYYSDSDGLQSTFTRLDNLNFLKPILFKIPEPDDAQLYDQEKNLYLLIQLPNHNDSSIVVLEGVYTAADERNLSLLQFNCKTSFAFSDRLIEYLLLNVVSNAEEITPNINYLQNYLHNYLLATRDENEFLLQEYETNKINGVWDDTIKDVIWKVISDNKARIELRDQDGFMNKDIERILAARYSK